MPDFSDILLASDYDRTLTCFDGTIPPANREAVRYFMAHGGAFTVATGRSLPMFRNKLKLVEVNAPVILFNGAATRDFSTGETTFHQILPPDAKEVAQAILAAFPGLRLEIQCLCAHYAFGRDDLRDAYLARNEVEVRYTGWDEVETPWMKLTFYAPFRAVGHALPSASDPEEERPFAEIAGLVRRRCPGYIATRSMPRMIEVEAAGTSKGAAARRLACSLGRSRLICVGDAPNDLPMLREADEAFVPADCDPAIAGCGFAEAAPCGEGTVASVIARLDVR